MEFATSIAAIVVGLFLWACIKAPAKALYRKHKKAINRAHFREGFRWAMEAHFLEGLDIGEIESSASHCWSWDVEPEDPYLKGVRRATLIQKHLYHLECESKGIMLDRHFDNAFVNGG